MNHVWRITVSLCGLLGACVEASPPVQMSGIVFDPEQYFLGNVQPVPNVQVFIVEDNAFGDISDSNGEFEIADLPANYNWHTGAVSDSDYLRTLDGLGTEVTMDDIENYHVPILRRGGLMLQFAKWLGAAEEDLDSLGLLVIAVMDDRPPLGQFLRENINVSPDGNGCSLILGNTAFVTHDGESFALVGYVDGALAPEEFTGMMIVQAPRGCVVSAAIRDNTGEFEFLPHAMPIEEEYLIFQLYVPE